MKTKKSQKPKLSGAARRKLLRQQTAPIVTDGEAMRRIRVGRLETVDDWRKEIGRVYREMRFNVIRTEIGTRLTYVAEIGARLAKMREELQELEELRQQLAQLQNGGFINRAAVDYLPAHSNEGEE